MERMASGRLLAVAFVALMFATFPVQILAQAANEQSAEEEFQYTGKFPAPSLDGGVEWLNCAGPISIKDLRGKIVLLDFWTYCCINCIHVLPDLKFLEQKYPNQLVVIGVHAAKFENEKESENIREAIMRYEIEHPVVNDANMVIARKYAFSSWPTFVLIDPEGNYVGRQPGEGNRELFDQVIGEMVKYYRKKGTLDETPVRFDLEKYAVAPRPLNYPGKILADQAGGRLFITDSNNNRIVVSTLEGELLDVIGSGKLGAKDGSYGEASFDHPQGTALVGNTLYVADTENHLIRTVDLEAKTVSTLAGTGQQARMRTTGGPVREVALNSPWAMQSLGETIYIAMAGPHQLWQLPADGKSVKLYAGTGREDVIDGPVDASALAQPSAITTDGEALYFVDSEGSAVREIRDGVVTTLVGPHDMAGALFEFGDIDGVGDDVRLQHPIGLTYHAGKLYVADTYNDKIKEVDIKTRTAKSWLGTGQRGNGLDPVELNEPAGLSATETELYIADTNNHRVLAVDFATKATREITVKGLAPPQSTGADDVQQLVAGAGEKVEAMTVQAGESLAITVNFELPIEYKLNKLAPVVVQVDAPEQGVIDAGILGKRKRAESAETSAVVNVPLTGTTGETTIELSVSYQYCRDGVGGLCKFATKKWSIPINVVNDQVGNGFELTAKPE